MAMSGSKDDLYALVSALLKEVTDGQLAVAASELKGKNLRQDFNLDSLDVIKFIFLIEEKSGVKLPEKDLDALNLLQVDRLVDYVADKQPHA
jgi:acyl carrier protein